MSSTSPQATIYDELTIADMDFASPLIIVLLLWLITAILFNIWAVMRALSGWLINPIITKQVIVASSMAVIWLSFFITRFFWSHRSFVIIQTWVAFPLTLLMCLQHIELLKLFVSLSEYWTASKCRLYQKIIVVTHFLITIPCYLWPWGFENNAIMTAVFKFH
jgi:hypothetical protein